MSGKSGVKVDDLYVSVGADISELDADFALADKTVSQAMASLNRKNTKIKLQAEIDLSKATTDTEKFDIRQRQLQEQLKVVAERIKITNVEYQSMVKETTAASASSQSLENSLLRQKKIYAELDTELKKVSADRRAADMAATPGATKSAGANESAGMKEVAGGFALGRFGGVAAGALAVYETAQKGAQYIESSIDASVTAGNAVYKLGQRYHIAASEAARLNLAFKMTGTDANEAVPALTRLDRQILTAGVNGNQTTQALAKWGVQMQSAPGVLRPMNEQLAQLADGYQRASAQGMAQEYVAEVLGQKGLALIPILSEWGDLTERMGKIKATGLLDPELAHRVMGLQTDLAMQMGQLKNAVGSALMPVAEEILPKLIDAAAGFTEAISRNKDAIKDVASAFAAACGTIANLLGGVLKLLDTVGINIDNIAGGLNRIRYMTGGSDSTAQNIGNGAVGITGGVLGMKAGAALGTTVFPGVGTLMGGAIGGAIGYAGAGILYSKIFGGTSGYDKWLANRPSPPPKKADSTQTPTATDIQNQAQQDREQADREREKAEREAQKLAEAEARRAAEIARMNEELTNKLFEMRHNQLENAVHAVDVEMQKYREKGAAEELIEQATAERKAKIREEFENTTVAKIKSVWQSSLQNRLDDINRERKAYIQKGVDEVNAARWAEHEKRMAVVSEAQKAFKEQRAMLDAMRNAMAGGGTMEQRMNRARQAMLVERRKQLGITEDMRTSPQEMAMFSGLSKDVEENLWYGLEKDSWARNVHDNMIQMYQQWPKQPGTHETAGTIPISRQMAAMYGGSGGGTPVYRGTNQSYDMPPVSVNVTLNGNLVDKANFLDDVSDHALHGAAEGIRRAKAGAWNAY